MTFIFMVTLCPTQNLPTVTVICPLKIPCVKIYNHVRKLSPIMLIPLWNSYNITLILISIETGSLWGITSLQFTCNISAFILGLSIFPTTQEISPHDLCNLKYSTVWITRSPWNTYIQRELTVNRMTGSKVKLLY